MLFLPVIKKTALICMILTLSACSVLPRTGPSGNEILSSSDNKQQEETIELVDVNDNVAKNLWQKKQQQSFSTFKPNYNYYNDKISAGDLLEVTIWEAPPAILFGQATQSTTKLPPQYVNKQGKISVPFLGSIRASGKTAEELQNQIAGGLSRIANQPQVLVRNMNSKSASVNIIRPGNSIKMPLSANKEKVLDAVVAVGGANEDIQNISVQLTRQNKVKLISLQQLTSDPAQNITLEKGDIVTLLTNPLSFTALGAVGRNQQVRFSANGLSLAEAIGRMGGLIDSRSDPRGVYVFRFEDEKNLDMKTQNKWQQKGYSDLNIPVVYNIDLTNPKSMFWLQQFPVKDKDVVYVSNSSLSEFQKILQLIGAVTSPISSAVRTSNDFKEFSDK